MIRFIAKFVDGYITTLSEAKTPKVKSIHKDILLQSLKERRHAISDSLTDAQLINVIMDSSKAIFKHPKCDLPSMTPIQRMRWRYKLIRSFNDGDIEKALSLTSRKLVIGK